MCGLLLRQIHIFRLLEFVVIVNHRSVIFAFFLRSRAKSQTPPFVVNFFMYGHTYFDLVFPSRYTDTDRRRSD